MQLDVISWFLLTLFIGVFADKRLVKQGSLVCLFQNVTADNANKDVNLYVNGVNNPTRIVTFTFVNGHISMDWNPHMADNYSKIFMDPKRNICIANIDETYERKFKIFSSTTLGEVELTILKTNHSTTVRTALNETTQKGDALPGYAVALIFLMVIIIIMLIIIMLKKHIIARIQCKKSNSVLQPVQITSPCDSANSSSYQLIWNRPADEYRLQKYILRYREIQSMEQPWPLGLFLSVDDIPASTVSYPLSPLTPGRCYQVEIQAINTQGHSCSNYFNFRTKESVPQPVQVTSHRDSPDSTSYQLMWNKPDDGGSPLIKYIIRYCEVEIIPDGTEYELSKYLKPFESVDNILPSVVSYKLSPLTPRRYYLVEIQAINTQGRSLKSCIFKTKEGVPQPVQVTSHRDSPDSTSYKLMWDKPDDGGSPLLKYILQYCEVEINPNGTEYELSKPLSEFDAVDISPSDVSYTLSPLKPGSYYQVEVRAVNTIGMSSKRFIFKTMENFLPVVPDFQLPVQHAPCLTSPIVTDETNPKFHRLSKSIERLQPRNNDTVFTENIERLPPRNNDTVFTDTQSSTSNVEQNTNIKSKKGPEEKLESLDSDSDSNDEQDKLLKDSVDQNL